MIKVRCEQAGKQIGRDEAASEQKLAKMRCYFLCMKCVHITHACLCAHVLSRSVTASSRSMTPSANTHSLYATLICVYVCVHVLSRSVTASNRSVTA